MSVQFFQTRMGVQFFEVTMPTIATELTRLNENLASLVSWLDRIARDGLTSSSDTGLVAGIESLAIALDRVAKNGSNGERGS